MNAAEKNDLRQKLKQIKNSNPDPVEFARAREFVSLMVGGPDDEPESPMSDRAMKVEIKTIKTMIAREKTDKSDTPKRQSDAAERIMHLLKERPEPQVFNLAVDLLSDIAKKPGKIHALQTQRLALQLRELAGEAHSLGPSHVWWNPSAVYKEFAVAPSNSMLGDRLHIFPAENGKPMRLLFNIWNGDVDDFQLRFSPAGAPRGRASTLGAKTFNQIAGFAANGGLEKMKEAPSLKDIFKAKVKGEKAVKHSPWPNIAPLKKHEIKL